MKRALFTLIGAFVMASSFVQLPLVAKQKKQQAHSSSSEHCCQNCLQPVYACGYSNEEQTIAAGPDPLVYIPLALENDEVPPAGITHPVLGDTTLFELNEDGVYLLEWHMDISPVNPTNQIFIRLRDILTDTVISSSEQVFSSGGNNILDAGQTLAQLSAGTVLVLEVASGVANDNVVVNNATLVITRISE